MNRNAEYSTSPFPMPAQTNVGLDFGLFNYRLTGTIDYFTKVSENILLEVARNISRCLSAIEILRPLSESGNNEAT